MSYLCTNFQKYKLYLSHDSTTVLVESDEVEDSII